MASPTDQDKLSDDWGLDEAIVPLDVENELSDEEKAAEATAEWAAMLEGDNGDGEGGPDRVLNQDEIDSLLGFDASVGSNVELTGVQALINSALVSYERLPMLEIVFDRLVRLATTSLRNFTSDNVEATLDSISSVRFGDYLNSIPLPVILSVIRAEEWENYGLLTVDSSLIYSMIDVLLGGRRIGGNIRIEGRPYTTIERNLVERMIAVVLADLSAAFDPLSSVTMRFDRLETNPRFATIARPANAAILAVSSATAASFSALTLSRSATSSATSTVRSFFSCNQAFSTAAWRASASVEASAQQAPARRAACSSSTAGAAATCPPAARFSSDHSFK